MEPLLLLAIVAGLSGLLAGMLALGVMAFIQVSQLRRALGVALQRLDALEVEQPRAPLSRRDASAPAPARAEPVPIRTASSAPIVPPPAPMPLPPPPRPVQPPLPIPNAGEAPAVISAAAFGAALLALAVAVSIDAEVRPDAPGWLSASARLAGAVLVGAAMAIAGALTPRRPMAVQRLGPWLGPIALGWITAGVTAIFVAGQAFAGLREPAPWEGAWPTLGLVIMAAAGAIALGLAGGRSRILAGLGLAALFSAPALAGFEHRGLLAGYLSAATTAALVHVRAQQWPGFDTLTIAGAIVWIAAIAAGLFPEDGGVVFAMFAAGLAIANAWSAGSDRNGSWAWTNPVPAALAAITAAAVALAALTERADHPPLYAWLHIGFAIAVIAVGALRPRLAPGALIAAAATIAMIALWPRIAPSPGDLPSPSLLAAAAATAVGAAAGAWLMRVRGLTPLQAAVLAAAGPLAALLAAWFASGAQGPSYAWGGAALAIVAYCGWSAVDEARRGSGEPHRTTTALLAAGAVGGAAAAAHFAAQGIWLAAGLAVISAALAAASRRMAATVFTTAAAACAAAATVLLVTPASITGWAIADRPFVNALAPAYAVALLALAFSGWMFRLVVEPAGTILRRSYAGAAVAVAAAGLAVQVRHLANAGDLTAPLQSLGELGGHAIWLLGGALALGAIQAQRLRSHAYFPPLEMALLGGGGAAAIAAASVFHPWWGTIPRPPLGFPVFNAQALAFALPAAILCAYALTAAQRGLRLRAQAAGLGGAALGLIWALSEIRRTAQGAEAMASGAPLPWEMLAMTGVLLAAGAAMALISRVRWRVSLSAGAIALLAGALLKAAAADAPALPGWERMAAVGLALVAAVALAVTVRGYLPSTPAGSPQRPVEAP